ncbi:hypothetical protein V491_00165 [Pseudogymnoascus sp. VKM F-3775]|nr:hypothetical protein V491_00165 [Pseudogymnoascus sp. VKM F-3775]
MTVGWVAEPNCGRGTISIIVDCFATMLFSAWTVLHLDVQHSRLRFKIILSILFLMFPEVGAVFALDDLFRARDIRTRMRQHWVGWTLKQSFAIRMGAVHGTFIEAQAVNEEDIKVKEGWVTWLWKIAGLLVSAQSRPRPGGDMTLSDYDFKENADVLHILLPSNLPIFRKEMPTNKSIDKRSRSDWFVKSLALLQALGFLVRNIISRLAAKLPLSLLEIATMGNLLCAIIAYLAWMEKPQSLEDPFKLVLPRSEIRKMKEVTGRDYGRLYYIGLFSLGFLLATAVVALNLGFSWHTYFPSHVEVWLWRSANFICVLCAVIMLLMVLKPNQTAVIYVIAFPYVIVRLIIISQCFAILRASSPDIYEKPSWNWLNYWPHFGT